MDLAAPGDGRDPVELTVFILRFSIPPVFADVAASIHKAADSGTSQSRNRDPLPDIPSILRRLLPVFSRGPPCARFPRAERSDLSRRGMPKSPVSAALAACPGWKEKGKQIFRRRKWEQWPQTIPDGSNPGSTCHIRPCSTQ